MDKLLPFVLVFGIVALIMVGVGQHVYIKKVSYDMVLNVNEAEKLFLSNNIEESDNKIQDIISKWEKTEKILNIMLNHEDIHKISKSLIEIDSKLKNFSSSNNISSNFALLKMYIKDMEEGNKFTLGNVL